MKVPIYLDWQQEEGLLGEAVLIEKLKDGYTFILDGVEYETAYIPEYLTPIYSYERGKVRFSSLTDLGKQFVWTDEKAVNIRFLYKIGITSSSYKEEEGDFNYNKLIDNFLTVDGVEIF